VVMLQDDVPVAARMVEGTKLQIGECALALDSPAYEGEITGSGGAQGDSWFEVTGDLPPANEFAGATMHVTDGDFVRAYPVRGVEATDDGPRIFTKRDSTGFVARTGERWHIPRVASWG